MKKLTITSTEDQPGNNGNLDHCIVIKVSETQSRNNIINLSLSNFWGDHKTYDFNLSREAAIELMLALDVLLSVEEEEI